MGTLNTTRPKLTEAIANNLTLIAKPATEVVTSNGLKVQIRVVLDNITPDSFTVANSSTTSASATVTGATNAFQYVRLGDVVSGTGIQAGSTVTAINTSASEITLSLAATATGTVTLTFAPPTMDATLYILELDHQVNGEEVNVVPTLYAMDGTKVQDPDNDGDDEVTPADAVETLNLRYRKFNTDTFLTKARKSRTNS